MSQELRLNSLPRMKIPLSDIARNAGGFTNSRQVRADNTQLKSSIASKGLLVDPIVWHRPDEAPEYVLIQGHNRYECLSQLVDDYENGYEVFGEIYVRVYEGDLEGAEEINFVVDATPEPLNYMDEADRVARLVDRRGSQQAAADSINFSVAWVNQRYRLATGLCARAKAAARSGALKQGDAKRLSAYVNEDGSPDEASQHDLLDKLETGGRVPPKQNKKRAIRNKSEHTALKETLKQYREQGGEELDAERLQALEDMLKWYFLEKEPEGLFHHYEGSDDEGPENEENDDDDVQYKERVRA